MTNNWVTDANWSDDTAPGASDSAIFDAAGLAVRMPTINATGGVTGITLDATPTITLTNYNGDFAVSGVVTGTGGMIVTNASASGNFGRLVFTDTTSDFAGGVTVQGTGIVRYNTGATINSAFGSGAITLDGGTFSYQGSAIDINTATGLPSTITDRSFTNNVSVTSNGGTLNMNQGSGSGGFAVVYNTVTLGGRVSTTSGGGGNADGYTVAGTITLQQDIARDLIWNNATNHNGSDWIAGQITDGAGAAGNALQFQTTGRTLQIANGTNDYAGGTIVLAGNALLDVRTTGTLGTCNLAVESGGRIRLQNATDILTAGNLAIGATIDAQAGGAVGIGSNVNNSDRFAVGSAGVYGVEGTHSYNLNMSTLGSGEMFLGSLVGGTFSGDITAGAGNTYRLGGGSSSAVANLVISGENALTGNNALIVGSDLNTSASSGRTIIANNQNFVGNITINTDGFLVTKQNGGTSFGDVNNQIVVHGRLAATGANGVFNNAILGNIDLRPGAVLEFNNLPDYANSGGGNNTDRWDDSTGITLNGSAVLLTGARSANSTETVGDIEFNGNSALQTRPNGTSGQSVALTVASVDRQDRGVLGINVSSATQLGADVNNASQRIVVSDTTGLDITNGMVAPWALDTAGHNFLQYDNSAGVIFVGERGLRAVTYDTTNLNAAATTDIVNTGTTTLTDNREVYALRLFGSLNSSGTGTPFNMVTVNSGGVISSANNATIAATINSGAAELIFYNSLNATVATNATANNGQRGGLQTTGGFTKWGTATLSLNSSSGTNNYDITGGIIIQQGTINGGAHFNSANGLGGNLLTVNHDGRLNINNVNATILGLSGIGSGANVFNSNATVRDLTIDLASGEQTYEGRISQAINLFKTGAGTQILTGNLSYTGITDVNVGKLQIDGIHTDADDYTVAAGATLGGSGTIALAGGNSVTVYGILEPGSSPGTLTIDGDLNILNGASMNFEVGSTSDLMVVLGDLNVVNGFAVNIIDYDSSFISGSDIVLFAGYDSFTGDMSTWSITLPELWTFDLRVENGEVILTNIVSDVIPEPTTAALLGLAALALLRRRRTA